jgi:intein/homing endonuclease
LPAYLLGVLLGDGCISTTAPSITCHIDDLYNLEQEFRDLEYSIDRSGNKACIRFIGETRKDIVAELTRLGLMGAKSDTKFISREFLFSTVESRYALLQGLMDTDGTISDGKISYCSTSLQLAEDVRHLIRSLGGIVTLTDKDPWYYSENRERIYCKKAYILYIKHQKPEKLFRLERKKTKAADKRATPMYLRLVDYKVEGEVTGRCITVDNPNGLYITDDFIVTHNSYFLRWCAVRLLMRYFLIQGLKWVQVMLACEDYPSLKDRQLTKISRDMADVLFFHLNTATG